MTNSGCIEKHIGGFNQQAEDGLLALLVHRYAPVHWAAQLNQAASCLFGINQVFEPGGALPIHSDGLRLQCLSQQKLLGVPAGKGCLGFSRHPLAQCLRSLHTETLGEGK